jgi:hypothetical protein
MTASAYTCFAVGLPVNPTAEGVLGLLIVAVFCFAAGYLFRVALSRTVPSASSAGGVEQPSDEVVAVIAAAVAEVIDVPHRIVHVRGLTPEDLGWLLEGRMQHHASHRNPHPHR